MKDNNDILEEALSLYEEKQTELAVQAFLSISQNPIAQFCLGEIYWNHEVEVEDNNSLALYWYGKAAENGNALAQLWLGNNYCIGIRSKPDPEKAVYWYKMAADQNMTLAQYHLAVCYAMGWGTEQNELEAVKLMSEAAKSNFFDAELFLADYYRMKDAKHYWTLRNKIKEKYYQEIESNEKKALRYVEFLLSCCNQEDNNEAFRLLKELPILHSENGLLKLADCYAKGIGTCVDKMNAINILEYLAPNSSKACSKLKILMEDCST